MLQGPPSNRTRRWAAIKGLAHEISNPVSILDLYVMKGGKPSRVRTDTAKELIREGWHRWIEGGRVNVDVFRNASVPIPVVTEDYHGCQILVEESCVRFYWKHQARVEPLKTGSPGRPSSMDLVMKEFASRMVRHQTASSRSAESEELARWLADTHPEMPGCSAKTIMNKLPPSFQPRNGRE